MELLGPPSSFDRCPWIEVKVNGGHMPRHIIRTSVSLFEGYGCCPLRQMVPEAYHIWNEVDSLWKEFDVIAAGILNESHLSIQCNRDLGLILIKNNYRNGQPIFMSYKFKKLSHSETESTEIALHPCIHRTTSISRG